MWLLLTFRHPGTLLKKTVFHLANADLFFELAMVNSVIEKYSHAVIFTKPYRDTQLE